MYSSSYSCYIYCFWIFYCFLAVWNELLYYFFFASYVTLLFVIVDFICLQQVTILVQQNSVVLPEETFCVCHRGCTGSGLPPKIAELLPMSLHALKTRVTVHCIKRSPLSPSQAVENSAATDFTRVEQSSPKLDSYTFNLQRLSSSKAIIVYKYCVTFFFLVCQSSSGFSTFIKHRFQCNMAPTSLPSRTSQHNERNTCWWANASAQQRQKQNRAAASRLQALRARRREQQQQCAPVQPIYPSYQNQVFKRNRIPSQQPQQSLPFRSRWQPLSRFRHHNCYQYF